MLFIATNPSCTSIAIITSIAAAKRSRMSLVLGRATNDMRFSDIAHLMAGPRCRYAAIWHSGTHRHNGMRRGAVEEST